MKGRPALSTVVVYGIARKLSGLSFSCSSVMFDFEVGLMREKNDLPFCFFALMLLVRLRLRPWWEVVVRKAILSKLMVVWSCD